MDDELDTMNWEQLKQRVKDLEGKNAELLRQLLSQPSESALRARVAELVIKVENARALIDAAVEIMTPEQVGQWRGVRTWLETLEVGEIPTCR